MHLVPVQAPAQAPLFSRQSAPIKTAPQGAPVRFGGIDPFESKALQGLIVAGIVATSPFRFYNHLKIKHALRQDAKQLKNDADKLAYFELTLQKFRAKFPIETWIIKQMSTLDSDQAKFETAALLAQKGLIGTREEPALAEAIEGIQDPGLRELLTPFWSATRNIKLKNALDGFDAQKTDADRWAFLETEIFGKHEHHGLYDWLRQLTRDTALSPTLRLGVLLRQAEGMPDFDGTYRDKLALFPVGSPERIALVDVNGRIRNFAKAGHNYYGTQREIINEAIGKAVTPRLGNAETPAPKQADNYPQLSALMRV